MLHRRSGIGFGSRSIHKDVWCESQVMYEATGAKWRKVSWSGKFRVAKACVIQFWIVSDSLQPPGLQHSRLPCPSLPTRVFSNSCPWSQWCHPTISSPVSSPLLPLSIFPSIRVFSNVSALCIRRPKYWSFSISPSDEFSRLISFRIDWVDLFAVQGTFKSLLQHHCSKASVL